MNRHISKAATLLAGGGAIFIATFIGVSPAANAVVSKSAAESPFCTNLSANATKITSSISNLTNKLNDARNAEDQKVSDNRTKWDSEIKAAQDKADQQRQDNFTKLMAKATTDPEKAAVTTYEQTITDAVNARRSANQQARTAFRSAVDAARSTRRSSVDGQVSTFTNAANAAIQTAQSACASDSSITGGPAIRTAFVTSLKTARTNFQAARKDDMKVSDQVKSLIATRDASIKSNDATFETAAKAARQTLQAAFGKTSV